MVNVHYFIITIKEGKDALSSSLMLGNHVGAFMVFLGGGKV